MTEGNRGLIIGIGIFILVLIVAVVAIILIGPGASADQALTLAPTAEAVVPADTPTPPEATATSAGIKAAENVWERIQTSGTMMVGTSADYPPQTQTGSGPCPVKAGSLYSGSTVQKNLFSTRVGGQAILRRSVKGWNYCGGYHGLVKG